MQDFFNVFILAVWEKQSNSFEFLHYSDAVDWLKSKSLVFDNFLRSRKRIGSPDHE